MPEHRLLASSSPLRHAEEALSPCGKGFSIVPKAPFRITEECFPTVFFGISAPSVGMFVSLNEAFLMHTQGVRTSNTL